MSQCIESHVSKLRTENSALVDRITRQDAEIDRLQIQLSTVTEERDSLKTKVLVLSVAFCALCDHNTGEIYDAIIRAKVHFTSCYSHTQSLHVGPIKAASRLHHTHAHTHIH